ncbi:MAG: hypothetical protein ABH885_01905 [Candidatus Omnitrophota bacterium]
MKKTLLFNPVGVVHARNMPIFSAHMPDWRIRCIYNPKHPWFADGKLRGEGENCYFRNNRVPPEAFDGVGAVVLFSAQPRIPHFNIIKDALFRGIPVIAIEEIFQMVIEQGFVNEYFLPVDKLLVGSEHERSKFVGIGVPEKVVETVGGVFRYKEHMPCAPDERRRLIRELGVPDAHRVATLSLAYLTPSGETYEVRRKLLETVSMGLPNGYSLLVKPHPGETDSMIREYVTKYAPNAILVDRYLPIDRVLDITDVLFTRGNSMVVFDALQRGVPVVAVPVGRRTLFDELCLKDVIARTSGDVGRCISAVAGNGMDMYKTIFDNFLYIKPEQAVREAVSRISAIAENNELFDPGRRLMELALFWAFMGYNREGARLLERAHSTGNSKSLFERVRRLVLLRATREDLSFLKKWAGCGLGPPGYREWLIQSLWIKSLFAHRENMKAEDAEWLADYPPRMNRELFLPYAVLLSWCYLRAGLKAEARRLAERLHLEYGFINDIRRVHEHVNVKGKDHRHPVFWFIRRKYGAKEAIRSARYFLFESDNIYEKMSDVTNDLKRWTK